MVDLDKLKNMSQEEKEELVEKINKDVEENGIEEESNVVATAIADYPEVAEKLNKMSPDQIKQQQDAMLKHARYQLDGLLGDLSKKNLKRVIMSLLAVYEGTPNLDFGGTKEDKEKAHMIYAIAQQALGAKIFLETTNAVERAKRDKEGKND
jgi:hypothetical protein